MIATAESRDQACYTAPHANMPLICRVPLSSATATAMSNSPTEQVPEACLSAPATVKRTYAKTAPGGRSSPTFVTDDLATAAMDSEASKMKRSHTPTSTGSSSVDLVALSEYVERFSTKTVAVLGDFVADEFQFGEISRVSREAPVLILRHRETHLVPGGAANAANNLAALGARVLPITAVGQDSAGDALVAYFKEKHMDVSSVLRAKGHTTPTKTRFLAGWAPHGRPASFARRSRTAKSTSASTQKRIEQLLHSKLRPPTHWPFPITVSVSPRQN